MEEYYRMDDEEKEEVMGLLFAANTSDEDLCLVRRRARLKERAERSLWTASSTRPIASTLRLVRG